VVNIAILNDFCSFRSVAVSVISTKFNTVTQFELLVL